MIFSGDWKDFLARRFSASIQTAISTSGFGSITISYPRRARVGVRGSLNCDHSSDGSARTSTRRTTIFSYVAIRSDEPHREGLTATHPNLRVVLPLRERGIDKRGVIDLLERCRRRTSGLLPLALPQRLHILLLPAEDRMGEPYAGTPAGVRRSQAL